MSRSWKEKHNVDKTKTPGKCMQNKSYSETLSQTLTKAPWNTDFWAQCSSMPDHLRYSLRNWDTHKLAIKKNFKKLKKKRRERERSKYKTKFKTDGKSVKQSASVLLSWCLRSAAHFLFLFTGLWGLLLEVLSWKSIWFYLINLAQSTSKLVNEAFPVTSFFWRLR